MSNIFQSENLDKDFVDFQSALIETNTLLFSINSNNKPNLKRYHRLTYIIALLEQKLEEGCKEENKFLFLNEILSDLLVSSSIAFIGFYRCVLILTRRLIENFYNHIYYFDHPIEFELLNQGKNDYVPMSDLKSYYENHPLTKRINDKNLKNFNDQIFNHYQELCRTVHTKGETFMGLAKNLDDIKQKYDLTELLDSMNKTTQSIIYLLFKFHIDLTFTNVEKNLISKTFPKNLRSDLLSF